MQNHKENQAANTTPNTEISCGNCWGHQEWNNKATDKKVERVAPKKEAFILEFAKKVA